MKGISGCYYYEGNYGLSQDRDKALELWHRAGELGCTKAYHNVGIAYFDGRGVERNEEKANHYWQLSAIGGGENSRYNLSISEEHKGNFDRSLKHFMIAVGGGSNESLKTIKQLYLDGHAAKDDYAKALRAYQAYLDEIKSDDRDKAAAYRDDYKYM